MGSSCCTSLIQSINCPASSVASHDGAEAATEFGNASDRATWAMRSQLERSSLTDRQPSFCRYHTFQAFFEQTVLQKEVGGDFLLLACLAAQILNLVNGGGGSNRVAG